MPDDVGGAEEEKEQLGKITKQINAQEETLQSLFAEVQDLKAKLKGYDYEGGKYKDLAVDPETKALLTMNPPVYFLLDGSREAQKVIISDGAGHYFQLPKLTTAQRDLLTAVNGMAIYNKDTKQIEQYENGAWGALQAVKADLDGFPDELKKLTTAEIQQLENIPDDLDISAAQWGYVGALTTHPIGGDGTAGRIPRQSNLLIKDGTNVATLKCTLESGWNGDGIAETDDIPKGGSAGHFSLSATGMALTIEASGLTGKCVFALGCLYVTSSTLWGHAYASGDDIVIILRDNAGNPQNITTLVDAGVIYLQLIYITDA